VCVYIEGREDGKEKHDIYIYICVYVCVYRKEGRKDGTYSEKAIAA
jgi:hypothetical protein